MDDRYDSDSDTQDSDYDVDSDAESVCSTTSSQASQPSFKVFVNYPPHAKREDIKDHLRSCGLSGKVKTLKMFYDERKKSKGCGYIEVVPPSFGHSAIGVLNGSVLLGKQIRAKKYTEKRRNKLTKHESGTREECSTPSEESGRVKVFVGAGVGQKLPPRIETSHLEHHMRSFKSAIDEVVIATDPMTKQSKGYGFVFFKSQRAADAAIKKLNGSTLHGCNLRFELSKPKESHTEVTSTLPVEPSSSKVFVGALVENRLPSSIQTVHLEAHLWQFERTLQGAFIVMDPQTQQSKGYGFAVFKSKGAAEAAIRKLGGSVLHGCQLKLEIAKPSHSQSNTHTQRSQSQRYSATVMEPTTDGSGRKIHIGAESGGKLPNTVQSFHLQAHFWEFEQTLEKAYIVSDPNTQQSRGFGFAVFKTKPAAEAAIRKLNGSMVHGCQLKLEVARPKEGDVHTSGATVEAGQSQTRGGGIPSNSVSGTTLKPSAQFKVFVGNLPHSVQANHLQEHFAVYKADIANVYMYIPDGKPKRCGFVVFSSREAAEGAISALNGTKLHGSKIRVQHDKHTTKPSSPAPTTPTMQCTGVPMVPLATAVSQPPAFLTPYTPILPGASVLSQPQPLVPLVTKAASQQPASPIPHPLDSDVPIQSEPLIPLEIASQSSNTALQQPLVPLPTVSSAPNTVLLSNLHPEIDKETLQALCKGVVTDLRFIPVNSSSKQALVTFSTGDEAQSAIGALNGKVFFGQNVLASLQPVLSSEVPHTRGHLPSQGECVATTAELLPLSSAQCNLLTAVNPAGSSLYQELLEPFKTNQSVKIELLLAEVAVRFTGGRAAVESALTHFKSHLQRHIPIQMECMQTLVEVHPRLPQQMAEKYGVAVVGLYEKSTLLKLDGPASAVAQARQVMDNLIGGFQQSSVQTQITLTNHLFDSMRKRLKGEKIAVRVVVSPSAAQEVVVYSFTPGDRDKAAKILSSKPYIRYVPFQATPSLKHIRLEDFEAEFSVSLSESDGKIFVMGFMKQDVVSAQEKLLGWVSKHSVQFVPLACAPEQTLYLHHKLKCDGGATQSVLNELPAQVLIEPDRAPHFKGSPKDIETSQKLLLEGPLFRGLQSRSFTFTAPEKFFVQLEKHVLRPIKREHPEFEYLRREPEVEPSVRKGRRASSARGEDREIALTVFSQEREVFDDAVAVLEEISPCVRTLSVTHSNAMECVEEHIEHLEHQYRAKIVNYTTRVIILALTEREAGQCLNELRETIDSSVEMEKYLKIAHNQIRYFKQKKGEEWEELHSMCRSLKVFDKQKQEKDTALVRVEGTVRQVRTVCQRLDAMRELDYYSRVFTVSVERKHNRMWLRFWEAVIKEREENLDLIVVVDSKRLSSRPTTAENTAEYEICVCGGDEDGISEVEKELSSPQSTQKVYKQSELAIKELDKGRRDKKLNVDQYFVDVCIDVKEKKVVLTAPASCKDDLLAVEAEVEQFVSNRTVAERQITVSDPVLALILNSKSKASPHVAFANQLSKPHGVSVQCLRHPQCGLRLRGGQDALDLVVPLIRKRVFEEIQSTIDEIRFPVNSSLLPFFETPEFVHLSAKIRDELCVLCTFPKAREENEVIKSAFLKTSTAGYCIKLEICKGDITHEEVDAVVNAANEDLQHIGGLAKAILEAGGNSIQMESDLHVMQHGKLKTGDVVCLGAGNLACKKILHAVGPRWVDGRSEEEQTLYFTVLSCLQVCQAEGLKSLALPAISTGIFAVPDHVCIQASMKAIRDFCQVTKESCITHIRFVLLQKDVAHKFSLALDSVLMLGCVIPAHGATPSPVVPQGHVWEWMADNGSFSPYQQDISAILSDEYGQDPANGAVSFSIGKHSYVVHFSTMLQTNVHTRQQRMVRRSPALLTPSSPTSPTSPSSPSSPTSVQWKFVNDSSRWTPYSPSDSQAIETMYQSQTPGHCTINGKVYTFNFAQMCQINTATAFKRPIKRLFPEVKVPDQPGEKKERKMTITLRGARANLTVAKRRIDDKLEGALSNGDITFPGSLEGKVLTIIQQYKLDFKLSTGDQKGKNKRVTFDGLSSSVSKATSAIQEEVINYHTTAAEQSTVGVPVEWEPQTQQNLMLCAVDPGSTEWGRVVGNFQRTLPAVTVIGVTRIQNKWLWERYVQHRQRLAYKNNGRVNEMELFHGTRGNDPKLIYEGEDGFDMRYSSSGLWGCANYFAADASYSHLYAYTKGGSKEMFVVKVLTGDSYQCSPNNHLRIPPEKPMVVGGNLQFAKIRYDIVTGTTKGCQVFMTYDNDKAYPAYLIQYY